MQIKYIWFMRIGNRFDSYRSNRSNMIDLFDLFELNMIDLFDIFELNIFDIFEYIWIESIDHIRPIWIYPILCESRFYANLCEMSNIYSQKSNDLFDFCEYIFDIRINSHIFAYIRFMRIYANLCEFMQIYANLCESCEFMRFIRINICESEICNKFAYFAYSHNFAYMRIPNLCEYIR